MSEMESPIGKVICCFVDDPNVVAAIIANQRVGILIDVYTKHSKYGHIGGLVLATHPEICSVSILVDQHKGQECH